MSKATVKKMLMSMPKEEIIGMVLEMYGARKEAKEYLEFYANPDEDGKLEEYKKIITEEFYPSRGRQEPKTRFSVCRKAVSDYKKLKHSPDKLADLMLCYVENACQFTYDYGDMWEQYYTSVENNFEYVGALQASFEAVYGVGLAMWMGICRYNCRYIL